MFEIPEINQYMGKQELVTELSKIKEKLLCRKKESLLEMGYHETPFFDLIESDISECAIKGRCRVMFRRNYKTVDTSYLYFLMEPESRDADFEKEVKKIADNTLEVCKEVFGFHNIIDNPPPLLPPQNEEILQPSTVAQHKFRGVAENSKIMNLTIIYNKSEKKAALIYISIVNFKGEDKNDGK